MLFPPGDVVAAFSRHMHFQILEQKLRERHPQLADRVRLDDFDGKMLLKVALTGKQSVGLAQIRMGHAIVWAVLDPVLNSEPSVWPVHTPDEVLVDALHAVAHAHLVGEPIPSPWCWHESEHSEMTKLADLLDARGVRVRRVAVDNGYFPCGPRHAPKLDFLSVGRSGPVLEAECAETFVRVSLGPVLGWMVDVHSPRWNGWGRVELDRCLRDRPTPVPGMLPASVSVREIAELLCRGPEAWGVESAWHPPRPDAPRSSESLSALQEPLFEELPTEDSVPGWFAGFSELWSDTDEPSPRGGRLRRPDAHEIAERVCHQLRVFGFADLRAGDADTPIESDTFHIVWHSGRKALSTSEIQKLNGLAAAGGEDTPKRLIVITGTGVTKPAGHFADQAKAFAFYLDRTVGALSGENTRAHEAMLPGGEPSRRGLEPW